MSIYPTGVQQRVQGSQDLASKRLHHGAVELPKDSGDGQEAPEGLYRARKEYICQTRSRQRRRCIKRDRSRQRLEKENSAAIDVALRSISSRNVTRPRQRTKIRSTL